MFDNIGGKIKGLATFICVIGIIASVIAGISIMAIGGLLSGLLVMIVGSLISWIGSFFMYGFGELIEKTTNIEAQLYSNNTHIPAYSGSPSRSSTPVDSFRPVGPVSNISSSINGGNADFVTEEYDSNRPIPPTATRITGTCEICNKSGTTTFIADVMDRSSGKYDQHRVCLQCYRHYRCKPSDTK